jgi:hypothetical protein
MAQFKASYKTRFKLQKAIQQVIRQESLMNTYTLLNSVRVSSVSGDLNSLTVTINAVYYYMFLDKGADLWNDGIIAPFRITERALESPLGVEFQEGVVQEYLDWMDKNYPILEVAKILKDPTVSYQYQLYGDPDGTWNGIFD